MIYCTSYSAQSSTMLSSTDGILGRLSASNNDCIVGALFTIGRASTVKGGCGRSTVLPDSHLYVSIGVKDNDV